MSRRASPTLIGGFVVGAVVLAVIAVAVFGSGRFFRRVDPYVLFFSGNVNGLKVGAPVKFKGVEIGMVKDVLLNVSAIAGLADTEQDVHIPVIIELDEANITKKGGNVRPDPKTVKLLVEHGLRAQLSSESLVTGLLYVKLDMHPGSPLRLVSDPTVAYPEIPTLPTPFEEAQMRASEFLADLQRIDFEGLLVSLRASLDGAAQLLNSPDLKNAIGSLDATLHNLDDLIAKVSETSDGVRSLSSNAQANISTITQGLSTTLAAASETLHTANGTLMTAQAFVAPDAPVMYQLSTALEDLSAAARGIRRLTEDLERNPSVLVRGKATEEEAQ